MDKSPLLHQREYWDQNLDPKNLGQQLVDATAALAKEKKFYLVPDRERFLAVLGCHREPLVLELGAGLSYQVIALLERGCRVVAYDLSFARLCLLRRLVTEILGEEALGRIHFVAGSAEMLPFVGEGVDVITTRAVLIHTALEKSLPECARVLKASGTAVFTEPQKRHPLVNLYRRTFAPKEWREIARYFDREELQLVRHHFAVVEMHFDYLFSFLAFVFQYAISWSNAFWFLLRPCSRLDQLLLRRFPSLSRYAWFATMMCRKER